MKATFLKSLTIHLDGLSLLPGGRRALIFGFILAGMGFDSCIAAVQDFLPSKYERRRYDAIKEKNPFALEVDPKKEVKEEPSELAVAYVMRVEGKYVVGIVNTDSKSKDPRDRYDRLVEGEAPNPKGLQLVKITPNADPKKVTAVIARNGRQENIKYDEKRLVARKKPASASKRPGGSRTSGARTSGARTSGARTSGARRASRTAPPGASAAGRSTSGRGSTRTGATRTGARPTAGRGASRTSRSSSTPRRRVILPPANNRR